AHGEGDGRDPGRRGQTAEQGAQPIERVIGQVVEKWVAHGAGSSNHDQPLSGEKLSPEPTVLHSSPMVESRPALWAWAWPAHSIMANVQSSYCGEFWR